MNRDAEIEDVPKLSAWRSIHLTPRFFVVASVIVLVTGLGMLWSGFAWLGVLMLAAVLVLLLVEAAILWSPSQGVSAVRIVPAMFSLSDENEVRIELQSSASVKLKCDLFDETPFQFQQRDFHAKFDLEPNKPLLLKYTVAPKTRGSYQFGNINVLCSVLLGLIERRRLLGASAVAKVYPSIIQMKKYELQAFAKLNAPGGIRKLRRLGHSYEFDQIKYYTVGDDVRSINWKATGRRGELMVNQYEDERSQQVITIIDKSRSMHMPFNGLSLLDYSINTSLVISNIALKKHDKVGLITYSHRIGSTLPAEKGEKQLKKILESLYREKPQSFEADYDLLYRAVKNLAKVRSLIFLYLNFESSYAMERALDVLHRISKNHLLVVVIFENTELEAFARKNNEYVSDIYAQAVAQKLLMDKKQLVSKLRKYGIQTILSKPEELSINTVNKYLELKSKGAI
jgi:uncharacterized protein (DUF58 family)